ncbi:MAG TPA: S-layer homology domain-containing protein [Bacilli bacterium]|nr:S-layer homology domain-containing protein [Bacilli bacterium]
MNKGKKITAAVAASAVASALVAPAAFASTTTFTDISNHWAKDAIQQLADAGIINGMTSTTFAPDGKVTRAQFAKILVLAAGVETEGASESFADVNDGDWHHDYVAAAVEAGIVNGISADKFGPNDLLTREQMAVMFVRSLGVDVTGKGTELTFADKDSISSYAKDAVAYAVELGLINGKTSTTFDPQGNATRAEVATVASRYINTVAEAFATDAAFVDKNTVTVNFSKAVESAEGAEVAVKASGEAVEVTGAELAEDGKSATLTTADLASGTTYTVTFGGKTVEFATPAAVVSLEGATALTNNLVEVTLGEEVSAVNAADFTIENADGEALEVTGATLVDGTTVELNTAAQDAFTVYTVKANDTEAKFVGLLADEDAPTLDAAYATKNDKVLVTFSEEVGRSALNISNYDIEGLSVLKAEYKPLADDQVDKTTIVLTTSSQTEGTIYTAKVSNVTDLAGNVIDSDNDEMPFGGQPADEEEIAVSGAYATTNTSVTVNFNDVLDQESAENISNYSIEGLSVLKAELSSNGTDVVLTTSAQTEGSIYNVVVSGVTDEAGNGVDTDNDEFPFGGRAVDTEEPTISVAYAGTNTSVYVEFSEDVDNATAEDIENYSIEGLTIVKAEQQDDKNIVKLTTSEQVEGNVYTLEIANVEDVVGNVLDTDGDEFVFGGRAKDTVKPHVDLATSTSNTQVQVTFNEQVDPTSALKPYNYYLGSELGYPTRVTKVNDTTYALTTKSQDAKVYTLSVNGVTDLSGNVVDADYDEVTFGGYAAANETVAPHVVSAVAKNNNTVVVSFNEKIEEATIVPANFTFTKKSGTDSSANPITAGSPVAYELSEDGKSVTLQFATETMTAGVVYNVQVVGVTDLSGNTVDADYDTVIFAGTSAANAAPDVTAAVLVNNQTLKITFSEPVSVDTATLDGSEFTYSGTAFAGTYADATLSDDAKTLTVYYSGATKFAQGSIYTVTVGEAAASKFKDALGVADLDVADDANDVKFAGVSTNVSAPKVAAAVAVNTNTIDLTFDQVVDASLLDEADITLTDNDGTAVTATAALVREEGTTGKKVRIFFDGTTNLTAGKVYKLSVVAGDIANFNGVTLNTDYNVGTFAAVSTANAAPKLVAATATSATTLHVTFSEIVTAADALDFALAGNTINSATVDSNDPTSYDITLANPLTSGTIYELSLAPANNILDEAGVGSADVDTTVKFVGK